MFKTKKSKKIIIIVLIVAVLSIISSLRSKTVFEFQINGKPESGIVCKSLIPEFKLITDSSGQIIFNKDLVDKKKTLMTSFYKNDVPILHMFTTISPNEYVIYNFKDNDIFEVTRIKKWWFITSKTVVTQTNTGFLNSVSKKVNTKE